jgi:hypothetical protein
MNFLLLVELLVDLFSVLTFSDVEGQRTGDDIEEDFENFV